MDVNNKVVLITGASQGIGKETALAFAKQGARLVLTYFRHEKEAEAVARTCTGLGASSVIVLHLDIADQQSVSRTVKEVVAEHGHIDLLINNAGVIAWKPLAEQTIEEINSQVRVNLEGLIRMTKTALPHIKHLIINIASGAGKSPYASLSTYCATKYGVRGFSKSLAKELKKVKVFIVNPGMTKTRMTNFVGREPAEVAKVILNTAREKYGKKTGDDVDVWDVQEYHEDGDGEDDD